MVGSVSCVSCVGLRLLHLSVGKTSSASKTIVLLFVSVARAAAVDRRVVPPPAAVVPPIRSPICTVPALYDSRLPTEYRLVHATYAFLDLRAPVYSPYLPAPLPVGDGSGLS